MLKGDLASTALPEVLRQLADGSATGCLHVVDPADAEGKVYLRAGRVYAVVLPGTRPTLGARLVTSGALAPEALAEALEAQETELQGWRLGELLVHLGYVDQPVVEAFVQEQVREQLSDLLMWNDGTWRFRVNQKTREDVAPPVEVTDLLAEVERRRQVWREIAEVVHGPDAVPLLSAAGMSDDEMVVDGDAWSMLCKVDGVRTVAELARDCGLTLFEAGHVVHALVQAGLLDVEAPEVPDAEPEPEAEVESFVPSDVASRLASAFAPAADEDDAPLVPVQPGAPDDARNGRVDNVPRVEVPRTLAQPDDHEVSESIDRVSAALSALLGQTPSTDDLFAAPSARAAATATTTSGKSLTRRDRDAAELAAAQTELDAARAAHAQEQQDALEDGHVADVVDLQARRDEDTRQAEAARVADEEAEAARVAEEEAEAASVAEEAEAARLAEEAEAARLAEAADAARLAEEAEAARAAEEGAARQAEEAEAARLAEEAEAARLAEEAEAARLAEEAEAARAAEEEAARLAEEAEAARLAEEAEAARLAEEAEAARAAEEEAARQAEEAEAARLSEEAEAARLAEEETARQAEEAEAARLAEEAEAARLAEEAEAARLAEEETARLAEEARQAEEAEAARLAEEEERLAQARATAAAEVSRLAAEAEEAARERKAAERAEREREAAEQAQLAEQEAAAQFAADTAALAGDGDAARASAQLQADVFAELSASASLSVPEQATEQAPEAEPEPEHSTVLVEEAPMPSYEQTTDTAALLRELSSLGLDDDPPPPPPTRPVSSSPRPVAQQAKKRKGLFGR